MRRRTARFSTFTFHYFARSATDCCSRNFAFFMQRVSAAPGTEFLDRKFVGLRLFVLGGRIVARFASVA
jgi:hypothetical protein